MILSLSGASQVLRRRHRTGTLTVPGGNITVRRCAWMNLYQVRLDGSPIGLVWKRAGIWFSAPIDESAPETVRLSAQDGITAVIAQTHRAWAS